MSDSEKSQGPVNPHTGQPIPPDEPTGGFAQGPVRAGNPGATRGAPPPSTPAGAMAHETATTQGPGAPEPTTAAPAGATGTPAAAPSQQEMAVRSALETVMDPEIQLSVIDLGLIREIHFEPGRTLVKMMLTTPFCPYAPQLMADVKQATMGVVPQLCDVEIMPDAWSPDLMPDPGLLGYSY